MSAQRRAIADAIRHATGAFSVDSLAAAVRSAHPGIGLATVYRAVAAMLASGFLERVGERDGSALYARCDTDGHHHHIVCTGCGSTATADCPFDAAVIAAAQRNGFVVTRHEIALYGLCASCRAATGETETSAQEL